MNATDLAQERPRAVRPDEQAGYKKGLSNRQVQMIGIGGAIGTGLFLGAGGRLASAGPILPVVYAVCGIFAFFVLRALGELVLHRPSSGSFVSYAREFYGEKAAYVSGWVYAISWALTAIVDITAIAVYFHYWTSFSSVPQWVLALAALAVVTAVNLISVKVFGELEFWFSVIKVGALVIFLLVGGIFFAGNFPVAGHSPGFSLITDHGGLLPNGLLPAVVIVQGIVFAYAGIDLIGVAAGETKNPDKVMPKAVNAVIFRIAIFYVGATVLLALLLPFNAYKAGESPFVTFFAAIGVPGAGDVMNFVVLTAALSSLNAGLYSTGRIYRSMAQTGAAPRFMEKMSKGGVPYGGILFTAAITLLGVGLNAVVPAMAFEIALNATALAILCTWATIILCQLKLFRLAQRGVLKRPSFRMLGAPWTSYLTLIFLGGVLILMLFDFPVGTYTIASLAIFIPALIAGWFAVRKRVNELALVHPGSHTLPVISSPAQTNKTESSLP
ncbi:L-asparagine permease [Pseudarthrobacter sulfonivorans]|uniref:L-asparagine permease n=1 Tax=Pseudarthrobacter sulfonivorans TaxID=121292 RepID=A0A0U3NWY3_9MICC|nr:amino acid permease [Pseudarthrobacter sulfonivorans]ALV41311.1 L-asparagine permease [Pseudarthrobacter sulfonivorans]